jgi:CHAT domain-containing protein
MLKHLSILIAIVFSLQLKAQDSDYIQADYDFANGSYEKAYQLFRSAGNAYDANQDYGNYASCNLKMAQCRLAQGKADLCVQLAERTTEYIEEVLSENQALKAKGLSILGEGYLNLGRNDLALEALSEEEQIHAAAKTLEAAACYSKLGIIYWNTGNKSTALAYHERSLAIKEEMLDHSDPAIADSYNNIGLIYLEDEYLKAISYFNKAIEIYEMDEAVNQTKIANCYSNMAFANSSQGNYNEALQYIDLVMYIWDVSIDGDHPNKAFTLSNKGRILENQGDLNKALYFQQEALHQYLRIYGEKHPEVANANFLIGSVYQKKEKYELAVEYFQSSIYANLPDQESTSVYDLPEIKNYYNGDILLSSLQSKAGALEALHYERTLKPRDLIGSLDTYTACDELISQIRQLRLSEADKLRLGNISSEVYDNGIRIAVELSRRTLQKKQYMERAFDFCERSKSAILLEAIQETKAKSFSGIPENLLVLEDSLKTEISYLKQKLAQSNENKETLKDELFEYEQKYRQFIEQLEADYPAYFNLKYNQTFATVEALQESLSPSTAILSYFTGENTIYIFNITKKSFDIYDIPKADDFFQTAKAFRNSIKYDVFETFERSSVKLYKQLIPDIDKRINHLIVLPDGVLGTLPFEAFTLDVENERTGYAQLTYLLEKYGVSYDYAATLLLDRLKDTQTTSSNGILLAAPVTFTDNDIDMPDLPATKDEVNEIRYLFISTDQKPTIIAENDASETTIKAENLSKYKYLHFATHGLVNESKPELSRVFLYPTSQDDGSLFSGEIYNLNINADLVTLSACETGLGKLAKGEGIIGLSRSLMYAGAKNLIVSLWQVADQSTSELMIDFYKQHLHHSSNNLFNDDLRKAKLTLLHSEKYASPYYWAPFILVGD